MKHFATSEFWDAFDRLPAPIQTKAKKNFELLKTNASHPSLHFKKINQFRTVRVGLRFRALAIESENDLIWFWIGSHAEYDKMVS